MTHLPFHRRQLSIVACSSTVLGLLEPVHGGCKHRRQARRAAAVSIILSRAARSHASRYTWTTAASCRWSVDRQLARSSSDWCFMPCYLSLPCSMRGSFARMDLYVTASYLVQICIRYKCSKSKQAMKGI